MAHHRATPSSGSSSGGSGLHFLNSPFGDTTLTKVFVGGLAWETQNDTLRQYFEHFGDILEAVVITDKNTGRSKGYGFVTFRDPESARRACADPNPVIDGRRANCNLASLRRPWAAIPPGMRPIGPFIGGVPVPRDVYAGGSAYHQPVSYGYQQGPAYPSYGYITYGQEYLLAQNAYNPYIGSQYVQVYGVPGSFNPTLHQFGQFGQSLSGGQGYTAVHGYTVPSPFFMQYNGPNLDGVPAAPVPAIQAPFPPTIAVPAQPQFIVAAHSPQFTQGTSSDQTTG